MVITQGVSPVLVPVMNQKFAKFVGVVESAPRGMASMPSKLTSFRSSLKRIITGPDCLYDFARKNQLSYFLHHRKNSSDLRDWLINLKVDLVLVYTMSQLLPGEVLTAVPLGVLNLHPSLLPDYRGPNPWFWVAYDDVRETGISLHYVDSGEDTGDIIFQRKITIPRGVRLPGLIHRTVAGAGVEMIIDALRLLGNGEELPRLCQVNDSPTVRARNVDRQEYPDLINWAEWGAERVWHFMRATESYLTYFIKANGFAVRGIPEVSEFSINRNSPGDPGEILNTKDGFYVCARDGVVNIRMRSRGRLGILS